MKNKNKELEDEIKEFLKSEEKLDEGLSTKEIVSKINFKELREELEKEELEEVKNKEEQKEERKMSFNFKRLIPYMTFVLLLVISIVISYNIGVGDKKELNKTNYNLNKEDVNLIINENTKYMSNPYIMLQIKTSITLVIYIGEKNEINNFYCKIYNEFDYENSKDYLLKINNEKIILNNNKLTKFYTIDKDSENKQIEFDIIIDGVTKHYSFEN